MKELSYLFGSVARVKILRLFVFNPAEAYAIQDVVKRTKITPKYARKELSSMEKGGILKKNKLVVEGGKTKKKTETAWSLDSKFPYIEPLQGFLFATLELSGKDILKKIRSAGVAKVVIISGLLLGEWCPESRVDLFVVGDGLNEKRLAGAIQTIESEIGREIRYTALSVEDFKYRLRARDKLIRDILDYPHFMLRDNLGISEN